MAGNDTNVPSSSPQPDTLGETIIAQFIRKLDTDCIVTPCAAIDRFTDRVLAGLNEKATAPKVIEMPPERICSDCDGTGSIGRGGSYEVADQCCDTCRGRGVLPPQPADGKL